MGVTGQPESNVDRIFRVPGVVVMVLDACVAADAVASPSSSPATGSDLGPTSAPPSMRGWVITSVRHRDTGANASSGPPLAWVVTVEAVAMTRRRLWWRCGVMLAEAFCVWLLEGQLSGRFPGQLLPRGPRPPSSTSAIASCVTRCVAAARLELDDPLTAVHPHANLHGHLPPS